ncbi:MAG: type II/IV secretion system protein [Gammaproteobacteria bacterium]|jgi:general secretion pathway protein E|nr:type II/IV secretion system protein [Gammaproteobacteria bacterium]MBT3723337.1 type II/IV secretion system protein [Gammaproteobacteria bacterium]MBT4078784.1 type II/IV secretion system protein [Gammaproteobacteria bacterium]MBT4194520.1 type II/IV secretion system protein [Gammaproteobacteria bacterium]MBT4449757.1 type II/IV secretion system protein [Gammaproteobacteria bacterium]
MKKSCSLESILGRLVEQGMVEAEKARMVSSLASAKDRKQLHALESIASRQWVNLAKPSQYLTLDVLTDWLASESGLKHFHFDPLKMDVASCTSLMSYAYAARFNILPVKVTPGKVTIAVTDPYKTEWLEEIRRIIKQPIDLVLANPQQLKNYALEFYSVSKAMDNAGSSQKEQVGNVQNIEQLIKLGKTGSVDADDQHIVSIVDWLMQYAFSQRASDIHIEPRREQGNVRFRIDGVMHQVYEIPANITAAVTSRIKIMGRLDVAEKRKPQDGRIKTLTPEGQEVEMRLSSMPTAFGEKLVLRIFDPEVLVRDFADLGFESKDSDAWNQMIRQPFGIILVTGPTGSGKTTTLYTSLKHLAVPEVNVCTIEDPIELVEPLFNQMQVQHNIGVGFASGVKTLLRQDPDIIMIGEIRDKETAEMAIQAALTGHLVLSTLHTNDAPSAVARLTEIGVPPYLISATLLGVVAQRLIRTLCPHCKKPVELDHSQWGSLIKPWTTEPPGSVYQATGCLECRQTGFLGRKGIYEMMPLSDELKQGITQDFDLYKFRKQAIKGGMRPLNLAGAQKVAKGLTTIQEVLKVAPPRYDG